MRISELLASEQAAAADQAPSQSQHSMAKLFQGLCERCHTTWISTIPDHFSKTFGTVLSK
jgi:cytochrome c5